MKGKTTSRRKKTSGASKGESVGVASAALFGVCAGLILSLLLALVCSFICLFSADPDKLMTPLCIVSLIVIYFASGFFASRKKSAAIPCGLCVGGALAVIFWIISLFFSDAYSQGLSVPVELLIRLSFVAVSLVGSLLGVNVGVKRKRRRR